MNRDKSLHAVILAGGSGTRFWPLSRQARPKQFLNLTGKGSLLQQTLKRVADKVSKQNIWIVANHRYKKEIKRQAAGFGLRAGQMLWEPKGKNTAPAVLWAAAKIHAQNPGAIMSVFPSDHLIVNRAKFSQLLNQAIVLAKRDYLVTFGIVPTRPETGYGYLKTKKDKGILRVEKFIEKPGRLKAKQLIRCKENLWNSGMFLWRCNVILQEFRKYLPGVYDLLVGTGLNPVSTGQAYIEKIWKKLPNISIDYGILEKSKNVAAVAAKEIGWSDVGSWEALAEILPKDKKGNTAKGHVVTLDCYNSVIFGEKRLVGAIGLEGMLVIDTPDALLVCPKVRSQEVKSLVDDLKKRKQREV